MKNIKNIFGVLILFFVVVIGGVVLTQNHSEDVGVFKVGVILPLTSDAAKYGEPAQQIMQIALEEVNASGGINGKLLEFIIEDGECSGTGATNAAQKLITVDKVKVIIGGICSGESLAAVPVATKAKVAMISPGSTSPDLTGISDFFVRNYPSASTQGAVLADVAYDTKGWRHIAFIQEQTDYALGIYNAFSEAFVEKGGMVTKEEFPTDTTDFRSLIAKVKVSNPDALFVDTQAAPAAVRILTQVKELGWSPNILLSNIVAADEAIVREHQAILEGALAAEFLVDPNNERFANLITTYENRHGTELPYQSYAQAEYDAVFLVRDAIEAVGYDGVRIANWFRDNVTDWEGAAGLLTIKSDGDPAAGFSPEVIRNGIKHRFEE